MISPKDAVIIGACLGGGIGRRCGLKIRCRESGVPVRVRPEAPSADRIVRDENRRCAVLQGKEELPENEKGRRLTGALWGGSYDEVAPSGDLEQSIENSYLLPHEFPADPQQASRYVP
jgi:hypothetical protein